MAKIEGGYYIKSRAIELSDIAVAPPHIREAWDWLIKEANHKDYKGFKRGQVLCTYNDIIEGLKWYVGWCKKTYTKAHIETAVKYLKNKDMITTKRTTRGMFVTICNYSYFQDPQNYSNRQGIPDSEPQRKPQGNLHEEGQELRPDKQEEERKEKEKLIKDWFEDIYKLYPKRDSKSQSFKHFSSSIKTEQDYTNIKIALTNYENELRIETWKKPQSAKTWFNNWQDWLEVEKPSGSGRAKCMHSKCTSERPKNIIGGMCQDCRDREGK
jgi:hypothetical protein